MSRVVTSVRRACRVAMSVLGAGLILAACGTTTGTVTVVGVPSHSITVPLRVVACTTDNSCVTVGTSGSDSGPSSVGEFRTPNGRWTPLYVPPAPSSLVTTASCWSTACLIGGTQPSGDLLWIYDAQARRVTATPAPQAGHGVSAVSCFALASCAVVDSLGVAQGSRLSFTSDGGATWSTPTLMNWSIGDQITGVSCTDLSNCLIAASGVGGRVQLELTSDGGVSWSTRAASPLWNAVTSLSCHARRCVALMSTTNGSVMERSQTFGRLWSGVTLNQRANALACRSFTNCVVVGQTKSGAPWLATVLHRTVTTASLRYVPTPLTGTACGARDCVAVAVSTVVTTRP